MSGHWKQRHEAGGRLAVRMGLALCRRCGRGPARVLLHPVTLYFLLRRREERRDSRAYLQRVLGRARWRDVARHIHTFAATLLDRAFLLAGDTGRFDIRVSGLDSLHAALDRGRGVLVFGSHLGSFDVLRVLGRQRPGQKIRVVLDKGHSPAVTQLLDALDPGLAATVIDAGQDGPAIMFEIQKAASEGALVALLVDRVQPGEPSVDVPFLGDPAAFPLAPWLLAAVLQVPVQLAFGLYRGGNRYDLMFEPFTEGLAIARRERAAAVPALIARYAARLEHHVRDAPFNWFNFYDFWGDREQSRNTPRVPRRDPQPRPRNADAQAHGETAAPGDRHAAGDGGVDLPRAAGSGG